MKHSYAVFKSVAIAVLSVFSLLSCHREAIQNPKQNDIAVSHINDSLALAKYSTLSNRDSLFVDYATAKLIAENINRSEVSQKKVITMNNLPRTTTYLRKRTVKNDITLFEKNVPYFYIFNYDTGGFAIISTSKRTMPVLGYSEKGTFNKDSLPLGLLLWLDGEHSVIEGLRTKHIEPQAATTENWSFMTCPPPALDIVTQSATSVQPALTCTPTGSPITYIKGPLLQTTWDQGCGYNTYCPSATNGPCGYAWTGCVATSVSQVMRYWQYPSTYNWSSMPNNTGSDEIARLMHDVGVAVNMAYGGTGSSAYQDTVPGALKNIFHYSSASYGSLKPITVQSNLSAGEPVILGGCNSKGSILGVTTSYSDCHSWVCDGYWSTDFGTYSTLMFHMNFGWSSYCDGWYDFDSWDLPDGDTFQYGDDMVYNIHP